MGLSCIYIFFFFNDTATTEIYTLSLHDALPISRPGARGAGRGGGLPEARPRRGPRSEEHTSELQSPCNLVCRLLLEKKKCSTTVCPARSTRSVCVAGLLFASYVSELVHCYIFWC